MIIKGETVNKEVELIKSTLDSVANKKLKVATGSDKKDTSTRSKYLVPPIKPALASYYFDKSHMLARSCDILAEDIILGNVINISVEDESDENKATGKYNIDNIINSIKKSQIEIYYMANDYELNGAGCCKIHIFEDSNEFRLTQLPMESLQIIKIMDGKLQADPIYLIEQKMGVSNKKYYKIIGQTYPEVYTTYDGQLLELAWWIGGDNFYQFFKKPKWLQAIESLNSQIALESLDTESINSGNNLNGILFFNKESGIAIPQFPNTNESDEEELTAEELKTIAQLSGAQTIANEIKAAGTGTAVLYEETRNPMNMTYVAISKDNYTYLQSKSAAADQKIISSFSIPRERYMINDVKESMNSQKTAAFWEIYTKSLAAKQLPYENGLIEIIEECYPELKYDIDIDIEVPMFSELLKAKVDTITDLFLKGLVTLKQAIILLSKYVSDLNTEDYDFTNPIYEMRFFQGRPLDDFGMTDEDQQLYTDAVSGITDAGGPELSPQQLN
jgi:hypothetical protein